MALLANYNDTNTGVNINNAYINVNNLLVNKDSIIFNLRIYVSQAARNAGKEPVKVIKKRIDVNVLQNTNIFILLYQALKNTSEFSGALDV
jgi:archaellin